MTEIHERWDAFRALRFGSAELAGFLAQAHESLDPAGFAGQFGRTLVFEEAAKRRLPLDLREMRGHPTTTRIDGVLPLAVPRCRNIGVLVEEFLLEISRSGLRFPIEDRMPRFRRDLSLAYLALLHGRELRSTHRLEIEMRVECPHSAHGGQTEHLFLRGTLPLGGMITIFTTRLRAVDCGPLGPGQVGHATRLVARRDDGGDLVLGEP